MPCRLRQSRQESPSLCCVQTANHGTNANDCCCDGACSSTPTLSEKSPAPAIAGKSAAWTAPPVREGRKCRAPACRRESGAGVVRTEKLVVDADNDIRAQVESAVKKRAIPCAMNRPPTNRKHHAEREFAADYAYRDDGGKLGTEQFNHPFGQLAFIATTLVGLTRLLVRHYG